MPFLGDAATEIEYRSSLDATVKQSPITDDQLRTAYRENLDIVLEEVADLFDHLEGKTAVTADHRELLGERERPVPVLRYGHPSGVYVPELIEVPWLRYTNGERRDVVAEVPDADLDYDEAVVRDHLRDIGYAV